jgi:preprotein translocase subunit SecY
LFSTIRNVFKLKDLRNKLIFVLLALVIYRIGSHIPVPGINSDVLANMTEGVLGIMNTFSGGALQNFSIFALGVMPYITASIIIQLLAADVVPKLAELNSQGEYGRNKIKVLTRYLTVVIAFFQAIAMSFGFNNMFAGSGQLIVNPSVGSYLLIALILTIGSVFLMFMGEAITKKGVGNGISLIIFAGIVATFPTAMYQLYATEYNPEQTFISIVKIGLILLAILAITSAAIYVLEAYRKIPIQYAEQQNSRPNPSTALGENLPSVQPGLFNKPAATHLPIKLNTAGVIPVIFAVSIVMLPVTIATFWQGNIFADWIINNLSYDQPLGMAMYGLFIFSFAFFYAFIQMDPKKMADNLQKSGGYVPGIRPGTKTEEYLKRILKRLTFVGGLFLVVISVLPLLVISIAKLPPQVQIGGISLLIVIGVAIETTKQINSHLMSRKYRGFKK